MNLRVNELVVGLADSTAQLDTTNSTTVATDSINSALGSGSACPTGGSVGGGSSGKIDTRGLDDFLHRVAKEAQDHVFREDFVELKDGNQVVYKIDPASACGTNTKCTQKLTANPIRFAVTANTDDTLNVLLLVGDARHNPGTGVLGPKKLSVRADLAESMAAIRLYMTAEDQKNLPDHLNGVIEGTLEKLADYDFALSTSVIEKFDLLVGQAKGKPVAVTVLPSNPTTQLTLDSITNTIGYSANLGAVDVQVAGAAVCDDSCGAKEQTGTFSAHLGGFTGEFSTTKAATDLTFSGLGIGNDASQVALNGDPLGTLDVNPNNGRTLSVNFKKTTEGTLITFDPALDIKLAMMLNKLSESLRVDMPQWLESEILRRDARWRSQALGAGARAHLRCLWRCDVQERARGRDRQLEPERELPAEPGERGCGHVPCTRGRLGQQGQPVQPTPIWHLPVAFLRSGPKDRAVRTAVRG